MKDKNQDRPPPQPLLGLMEIFHEANTAALADSRMVPPNAVIFKDGKIMEHLGSVFFDENGDKDKDHFAEALRQRCSRHQADAICFMSEAYAANERRDTTKYARIRDMPDRIEIVMYNLETREGRWIGQATIHGEEGTPRTLEPIRWMGPADMSDGRFTGLLPVQYPTPAQVDAYIAMARQKMTAAGIDPDRKLHSDSLIGILEKQIRHGNATKMTEDTLDKMVKVLTLTEKIFKDRDDD